MPRDGEVGRGGSWDEYAGGEREGLVATPTVEEGNREEGNGEEPEDERGGEAKTGEEIPLLDEGDVAGVPLFDAGAVGVLAPVMAVAAGGEDETEMGGRGEEEEKGSEVAGGTAAKEGKREEAEQEGETEGAEETKEEETVEDDEEKLS